MKMWRLCVLVLFSLVFGLLAAGCIGDRTLDVIEEGIRELGRQPGRWKETMEGIIEQLEESGTGLARNVLAEVEGTYNGILGQTTGEFSCRIDFIAERLQQRLQAIGHSFDPDRFSAPTIRPVICSTNPGDHITSETDRVVYYGYDLLEFDATGTFRAVLQYADGTEVYNEAGFLARTHNYQLVLDLQSPMLKAAMGQMSPDKGPQLVLKWGDHEVKNDFGQQSALPVQLPERALVYGLHYAHVTRVQGEGGTGGYPFEVACPEKLIVTGLIGRAGARIDQISIRCSQLMSDGTTGAFVPREPYGGEGGVPFKLECPADHALTKIKGRAGQRVDQLQGVCTSLRSSETWETGIAGEGGGDDFECACPMNYVVTGLYGRAAAEVDQINLICTEVASW